MTERAHPPATRSDLLFAVALSAILILLWMVRGVLILASFALILAYILDPIANAIGRIPFPRGGRAPRPLASVIVVAFAVAVLGGLAALMVPMLFAQFSAFIQHLPNQVERLVDWVRLRSGGDPVVDQAIDAIRVNARTVAPEIASAALRWLGGVFARLDQFLGLAVLPVLTFYLLADQRRVRESLLSFMPEDMRDGFHSSRGPVHRALRSYVRGQAVVCIAQGFGTGTMLAMAGVPNALLLGVVAGLGEILPFIGALIATISIVLSGLMLDPLHALLGLGIYTVNNWLLGTFVTPRVMERYLKIHPFVVIVSVLAGASLLGPPGAILALPAAAVIQAVIEDRSKRHPST